MILWKGCSRLTEIYGFDGKSEDQMEVNDDLQVEIKEVKRSDSGKRYIKMNKIN